MNRLRGWREGGGREKVVRRRRGSLLREVLSVMMSPLGRPVLRTRREEWAYRAMAKHMMIEMVIDDEVSIRNWKKLSPATSAE